MTLIRVSEFYCIAIPTTNGGVQKWKAQLEYVYALHARFCMFWRRFLCSVGAYEKKISASELSREVYQ